MYEVWSGQADLTRHYEMDALFTCLKNNHRKNLHVLQLNGEINFILSEIFWIANLHCHFVVTLRAILQADLHAFTHMQAYSHTDWLDTSLSPCSHSLESSTGLSSKELSPELASPAHYCLNWTNLISILAVLNLRQKVPTLRGHLGSTETQ